MKLVKNLYLNNRLFISLTGVVVCFILSFIIDGFVWIPQVLFFGLLAFILADVLLLFRTRKGIHGHRFTPEKLSNGDENEIRIYLENFYPFVAAVEVIDEIPHQFQRRDLAFRIKLSTLESKTITYSLRPVKRGEYSFRCGECVCQLSARLAGKKIQLFAGCVGAGLSATYIQMRKYELLAISNRLTDSGIKKIRRIGQNTEFELIGVRTRR